MTKKSAVVALIILSVSFTCFAQSEAQLAAALEGKYVVAKMDLPATKDGVDVYSGSQPAVNMRDYAQRMKRYGTAVHAGERILVTKVKVKKDLIEVQLGGGGFGTIGDNTSSSVPVQTARKTERERDLERAVNDTNDPQRQRRMREELDRLRREREQEDARLRATVAVAEEMRRQSIREQALQGGSRFNLHYAKAVPAEALTPDALVSELADYLEFAPDNSEPAASPSVSRVAPFTPATIHKGQQRSEVEALLGTPRKVSDRMEGTLAASLCSYVQEDSVIEATFVEDILVRYTIASR
jgi:hypothetical protein